MAGTTVQTRCWEDANSIRLEMDRTATGLLSSVAESNRVGWNRAIDLLRVHPAS